MGARQAVPEVPVVSTATEDTNSTVEDSLQPILAENDPRSSQRIKNSIIESIHQLWLSEERRDLTVTVDNVNVRCHSFILRACSKYFDRLLHLEHGGANEIIVAINSFSKATFETILEALYAGSDVINSDNVVDVWRASHELEISFMVQECEEFVLRHLNNRNFGELHRHALFLGSHRVLEKTCEMIEKHLDVFMKCQAFLDLTLEDVLKIVSSQNLTVASEDIVIDAILKWVNYVPRLGSLNHHENDVDRKSCLGKLLSASRLSLVSSHCLHLLINSEIIKENREASDVLDRAIVYKLLVGQRHGQWPNSAVHRNNSDSENVAIAGFSDGHISMFSFLDHKWQPFKLSLVFHNCYITITVFDNSLYAFASQHADLTIHSGEFSGEPRSRRLLSAMQNSANIKLNVSGQLYAFKDLQWQKITDVPGVEYILIPHGESIYFLHPFTKKVLKLNQPFDGQKLEPVKDVPLEGLIESAIAFDKSILVFRQKSASLTVETTVHCLDTVTKTWSRLNNLMGPAQLISIKNDKDVYILQNNGTVSQIMTTAGDRVYFRYIDKLWSFPWQIRGAVSLGHTLYIYGSQVEGDASPGRGVGSLTGDQNFERKSSLTGVFESVQYIDGNFDFFQPVILPKNFKPN